MSILAEAGLGDGLEKVRAGRRTLASRVARIFDAGLSEADFLAVYQTHGHLIARWSRRFFQGAVTPEDVLQEVMILVMRKGAALLELDGPAQRVKWLRTTTIRVGLQLARREGRKAEAALPAGEVENTGARLHSRSSLSRLLSQLTQEERIIAVLHFEEGLNKADVAEQMQRSRPFIHKKLQHIQRRLADVAEEVVT